MWNSTTIITNRPNNAFSSSKNSRRNQYAKKICFYLPARLSPVLYCKGLETPSDKIANTWTMWFFGYRHLKMQQASGESNYSLFKKRNSLWRTRCSIQLAKVYLIRLFICLLSNYSIIKIIWSPQSCVILQISFFRHPDLLSIPSAWQTSV